MAITSGSDRIPPFNLDAERSVLGACLLEKDALISVVESLSAEDFYDPRHKLAFEVILEMTQEDIAVDSLTFKEAIAKRGYEERIGGQAFIAGLLDTLTTTANVEYHAGIVRDKAIHRGLITVGSDISRMGYDEGIGADEALETAEHKVFEIARSGKTTHIKGIDQALKSAMKVLEARLVSGLAITGVPTGFKRFDKMSGGLQAGSLYILAARPGMGKTAFAMNVAQYAAKEENIPVLIFSLEMSAEQLAQRMLATEAEVNLRTLISTQKASQEQWRKLTRATDVLSRCPIFVDASSTLTTTDMRGRCRRFFAKHKVENGKGLIVLDYLQLMSVMSKKFEGKVAEVTEISRSLKAVAREFDVPVIALSQLSRDVEKRSSGEKKKKEPQLSDLRDSGAIEQDADMVLFLYRNAYYEMENESADSTAELIVAKHRNGATGRVNLVFVNEYTKFANPMNEGY
ncbi:replicative DNA helicase [Synergistaceae bacterium OttesenSCG-928-D05]|nr:replicative DNA helicase [Synergistaceae bacterium OttesenSCG-928-D05]